MEAIVRDEYQQALSQSAAEAETREAVLERKLADAEAQLAVATEVMHIMFM